MPQDGPGQEQGTEPGDGPGEWLTVAQAARRLGITPKAIRNRLERGTLEWRPAGNRGREVLIRPEMEPGDGPGAPSGDDREDGLGTGPEMVSLWCRWLGSRSAKRRPKRRQGRRLRR